MGRAATKQAIFPLCLNSLDHGRQIDVGESVAVIGEEHLLVLDMLTHREEPLADIAPHPGVDHRDAPVLLGIAQGFDVVAEARHDAVGVNMRLVVEEEFLDDVGLVAETQDEILVSVLAVVAHQVPEDRLAADRDHRLGNVFGVIADPRAETSAEQNCFHRPYALRLRPKPIGGWPARLVENACPLSDLGQSTGSGTPNG